VAFGHRFLDESSALSERSESKGHGTRLALSLSKGSLMAFGQIRRFPHGTGG